MIRTYTVQMCKLQQGRTGGGGRSIGGRTASGEEPTIRQMNNAQRRGEPGGVGRGCVGRQTWCMRGEKKQEWVVLPQLWGAGRLRGCTSIAENKFRRPVFPEESRRRRPKPTHWRKESVTLRRASAYDLD